MFEFFGFVGEETIERMVDSREKAFALADLADGLGINWTISYVDPAACMVIATNLANE